MNEENMNNNEENENMNNEELEELEEFKDFNDIIREHIVELIEMSKDEDVGSENQVVLNNLALNWYKEFSKTQVDAHRIVIEDESRRKDRESAEELKQAELEARQKESFVNALMDVGKVILVAGLTTGIPLAVYKSQQDKILAAEYCDNRYVLDKNFADNKNEIMKLIKKFNG